MNDALELLLPGDPRSTVFERLSAAERRELDRAIVECRDGGLKGTYRAAKLADLGVSLRSFYRYARRVRERAALLDAADLTPDGKANIGANLALMAQGELLVALTLGDPSPRTLERLARTCYVAARTHVLMSEITANGSRQRPTPAHAGENTAPAIPPGMA